MWPDHVRALTFFRENCETQWRAGMGGLTGLDYTAILAVIQFNEPDRQRARELFDQLKLLERGALQAMADARKA